MPIGAQMFTLRDHCKTVDDIARSLERVSQMGYDGIQGSAAAFNTLDTDELKAIRKALDDNGLTCAATHESPDNMANQTEAVLEKHRILDCQLTAIGGKNFGEESSAENWTNFAHEFSQTAAKLAEHGLKVGYHNHSHEFELLDNDQIVMDVLMRHCTADVWFELDVYWVAHGGGDPAAWIDRAASLGAGRIPAVHYKDMSISHDRQHLMMPVGVGNLNWTRINAACQAAGVEWYLVERDAGPHDPFDALEISVKRMRDMGIA